MSTLEKAIGLLQKMPESKLEAIYMYICFVDSQSDSNEAIPTPGKSIDSLMGIAHKKTLEERQRGFQGLISFAGTLPEDFDYKKELEEARDEKYARFI